MDTHATDQPSDPSTTDKAKDKAQEAAGEAKERAGAQLRSQVEQRSTDAGERVGGFAADVRSVSETLREQGKDQPAKLAEQAADRADRLSSYLKDNGADRILHDVEDLGRRQPWAVIAGGVVLGFAASRFLKASSSRRYESGAESSGARLPAPTRNGSEERSAADTPSMAVGAAVPGSDRRP